LRGRRERGERYQKKHCGQTGHWLCEFRAFRRVTPLLLILCGSGASHVTRLGGPWQPEAMPFAGCCRGGGWGGHPPDGPHGPLRWTRSSATRLFWRRSCVGLRTLGARKASSGLSFGRREVRDAGIVRREQESCGARMQEPPEDSRTRRATGALKPGCILASLDFGGNSAHGSNLLNVLDTAGPRAKRFEWLDLVVCRRGFLAP
jgi:hypothetical protein